MSYVKQKRDDKHRHIKNVSKTQSEKGKVDVKSAWSDRAKLKDKFHLLLFAAGVGVGALL